MNKTIIFCADGTWNSPDQDENQDGLPDTTNVYKLFHGLSGSISIGQDNSAEQEKELRQNDALTQIAKYIHGVGDSNNLIKKIMGGMLGAGIISRIVRGYTFISRNYEPGDDIVVIGFSRGAYTVRALTGLIVSQGLLAKHLTSDKESAYRWGAKAWYRYRKQAQAIRLAEVLEDLPAFLSSGSVNRDDLIVVKNIKSVAVWDTVGSLGIPEYIGDTRTDAFRFADTKLSPIVEKGFHAVALDEQRIDFTPTFWEPADNVMQMLFPGAHGDIGGGYPTTNNESGLSDVSLEWMVSQLKTVGVQFSKTIYTPFSPNALGVAHQPWRQLSFHLRPQGPRNFNGTAIHKHPSIAERMNAGPVISEPNSAPTPYAPKNMP